MKKSIAVVMTVLLMISVCGCGYDINKRIDKQYKGLESYSARVIVTVPGSGKTETYEMLQNWKRPSFYRSEVLSPEHLRGTVSVINAEGIWLKSGDTDAVRLEPSLENMNTDYMFLSDFFSDYYSKENTDSVVVNDNGEIVLNSSVRGTNKHRFTQNLRLDAKKLKPISLSAFDDKGTEVLRIEYSEFKANDKTDDSAFDLKYAEHNEGEIDNGAEKKSVDGNRP